MLLFLPFRLAQHRFRTNVFSSTRTSLHVCLVILCSSMYLFWMSLDYDTHPDMQLVAARACGIRHVAHICLHVQTLINFIKIHVESKIQIVDIFWYEKSDLDEQNRLQIQGRRPNCTPMTTYPRITTNC